MKEIEYFYSAHSAFAYLGSKKLMSIANTAACPIVHKPVDLNRCIAAGGAPAFGARSKAHVDYYFGTEINRWSEYRGAPVLGFIPTHHNKDPSLANGMLIAGLQQGQNIDALAHGLLEAHWRDDADLADRDTLVQVGTQCGYDAEAMLSEATSAEVLATYEKNTEEAIARSVFGSPTYFLDGEMFYGQDRLEFIERALAR